jgi:hypothetical protein
MDLHFSRGGNAGWDAGELVLADTSPQHLGLSGQVETFLADTATGSPYVRQAAPSDVSVDLYVSPILSFELRMPLAGNRVWCSGTGISHAGLAGRCDFGPTARAQISMTLWRVPTGWQAEERIRAGSDTLYAASYVPNRSSACTYITPRLWRQAASNGMRAYVPCFGARGNDSLWSAEEPFLELSWGPVPFAYKRAAKLFVVVGFMGPSKLFDTGSDTVVFVYGRDTLQPPRQVYSSPDPSQVIGGDYSSVILYDLSGYVVRINEDLAVTRLPPLPRHIIDSTLVQAAVNHPQLGVYVIAVRTDTSWTTSLLRYDGARWHERTFTTGRPTDFSDAVVRGDQVYGLSSPARELWTLDLRRERLVSSRLVSAEPTLLDPSAVPRMWGELFWSDGSLHVLTDSAYVLYRVTDRDSLVPVLDVRIPSDSGPIPSRQILDVGFDRVLLDGGVQLLRRHRPQSPRARR